MVALVSFIIQTIISSNEYRKNKEILIKESISRDKRYNSRTYGVYGTFHATSTFTPLAILITLFQNKKILGEKTSESLRYKSSDTPTFIDLGSGIGVPVLYASMNDWNAHGIECEINCVSIAKENIKDHKHSLKTQPVYHHASFFPNDFKPKRSTIEGEDDFKELLIKNSSSKNIVGIDSKVLSEGDLWYHYQVERVQNILDLFSCYGSKNAYLILVRTRQDSKSIPNNIIQVDAYETIELYKKIAQ
ncbi:MAG: hypothetical protein ACMXYE_04925 [Candidatus Woesearchaeota archaeon]